MKTKYTVISAIVVVITALVSFHIGRIDYKVVYIPVEENLELNYKLYSDKEDVYYDSSVFPPCDVEIQGGTMGDLQPELLEKLPELCKTYDAEIFIFEDATYLKLWMIAPDIAWKERNKKEAISIFESLKKDNLVKEYSFIGKTSFAYIDVPNSVSFFKDIPLEEAYYKAYGEIMPNNPADCVKSIWFKLS